MNTAQDTLSPKLVATEAFTDATAAVGRLHDIYGRNTGFLGSGGEGGRVFGSDSAKRTAPETRRELMYDYIERFYNPKRRHSTIGYLSPMEFESSASTPSICV
jgi:transposase InsO family protein